MPRDGLILIAADEESDFQGIPVVIEHPKGSTRTGTAPDGETWARKMQADYGYVPDTRSKGDNEDLDVYIGPEEDAPIAYVVDQLKEDGDFDEVKVMLGFPDKESARACYLQHYPEGWESRVGSIWELPVSRLAELIDAEQTANEQRTLEEADQHEHRKTARFLTFTELREAARGAMKDPQFIEALELVGQGRPWEELSNQEQFRVLYEEQRMRYGGLE